MFKKTSALLLLSLPLLSSCSAIMALNGKPTPKLDVLAVGNNRTLVESRLGSPSATTRLSNGSTKDSYQYKIGADASPSRAIGYVALDLFLVFIPELVTIPIEATKGEDRVAEIIYDKNDNIVDMSLNKGKISKKIVIITNKCNKKTPQLAGFF